MVALLGRHFSLHTLKKDLGILKFYLHVWYIWGIISSVYQSPQEHGMFEGTVEAVHMVCRQAKIAALILTRRQFFKEK
jgi:hypothetical protein